MSATLTPARIDIDAPFRLTEAQIRHYRENGFVKLKEDEIEGHYERPQR